MHTVNFTGENMSSMVYFKLARVWKQARLSRAGRLFALLPAVRFGGEFPGAARPPSDFGVH